MAEQQKCKTCKSSLVLAACDTCGAMDCEVCLKSGAHVHVQSSQPASAAATKALQPPQKAAQSEQTASQPPMAIATPAFRGLDTMLVQPTPWLGCAAWNMNHFGDKAIDLLGIFTALTAAIAAAKSYRVEDLFETTFSEIKSVGELFFHREAAFLEHPDVDAAREACATLDRWFVQFEQHVKAFGAAIAAFRKLWPFEKIDKEAILRSEYTENPSEPDDAIRRMERTIAARRLRRVAKWYLRFAKAMPEAANAAKAVYPALVKALPLRIPSLSSPLSGPELKGHTDDARKALARFAGVDFAVLTTLHNRLKDFDGTMHKILTSEHVVNLFLHNPWLQVFALNEVNKGIDVLAKEIQQYAGLLRQAFHMPELVVIPGPLIESDSGKSKQLEYYPLVCRKDAKITLKGTRCFDSTGAAKAVGTGEKYLWNKKEKLYRPIVVYDLLVDNVPISLGTVHTTPGGSEFERVDVWKQLEVPLTKLVAEPQPVIICGDYYLTGEAAVVKSSDLTPTQISQMKEAEAAKTADGIQLVRNVLRLTVQTKLDAMGWLVCQPVSGTNWKTENVDEWQKGQIADFFIGTKKHFKSYQIGIMRPLGLVVPLDREDLHNSRYWRLCSDHFPVGGAFSGKANDAEVTAVVRLDGKAGASLEAIEAAVKNGTDPELVLTEHDFEPEPSGVVSSNPDNPPTARVERKDQKSGGKEDDDA